MADVVHIEDSISVDSDWVVGVVTIRLLDSSSLGHPVLRRTLFELFLTDLLYFFDRA